MVKRKEYTIRKTVKVNGVRYHELYKRTRLSFLGIPLFINDTLVSRERASI